MSHSLYFLFLDRQMDNGKKDGEYLKFKELSCFFLIMQLGLRLYISLIRHNFL